LCFSSIRSSLPEFTETASSLLLNDRCNPHKFEPTSRGITDAHRLTGAAAE